MTITEIFFSVSIKYTLHCTVYLCVRCSRKQADWRRRRAEAAARTARRPSRARRSRRRRPCRRTSACPARSRRSAHSWTRAPTRSCSWRPTPTRSCRGSRTAWPATRCFDSPLSNESNVRTQAPQLFSALCATFHMRFAFAQLLMLVIACISHELCVCV